MDQPANLTNRKAKRNKYINELRDWQWNCHINNIGELSLDQTVNNLANTNTIDEILAAANFKSSLNLLPLNLINSNVQNALSRNISNYTEAARAVLGGTGIITSREREAASMFRRFFAATFDWFFILMQMMLWVGILQRNNLYLLPNITNFYLKELPNIINEALPADYMQNKYDGNNLNDIEDAKVGFGAMFATEISSNIDIDKVIDKLLTNNNMAGIEDDILLFTLLFKIMSVIYETLFVWFWGATIGKYILNVEVVHYSSYAAGRNTPDVMVLHNSRMSLLRSLVRSSLKMLYFTVAVPIIIFILPFNNRTNQWYDKVTKTMVVKRVRNR